MPTNARQKITKVFHIDYKSELDDTRYQGTFTCKKASIQDRIQIGVIRAQLNGGMHYDPEKPGYGIDEATDDFNSMVAHLRTVLTVVPSWWNLDEIGDVTLIYMVYKEVAEHEASFRRRPDDQGQQEFRADNQGDSSSANRQTDGVGAVSQVVGEEVSFALEP